MRVVVGIDEVGVGPLAGPVVAAAVVLAPRHGLIGLADSKRLTKRCRTLLAEEIKGRAQAWALGRAEVEEVDRLNVLHAAWLAMRRAVENLALAPEFALVDGVHLPALPCPGRAIVRGDARVPVISAASIVAKVARDAEMCAWDTVYPQYGFASHKGYGTARHLEALSRFGACPLHRQSFAPVRAACALREGAS